MVGEGFTDLAASYCDAFWNWNQLDHPEVVRYSVPWMRFSCEIDALEYGEANLCFVHGILLDLKIEGGVGILSDFPAFQAHLRSLSGLKEALGDTLACGDFEDEDGIRLAGDGAVIAKIHIHHSAGCGAVLFANQADRPATAGLELLFPAADIERLSFSGGRTHASPRESLRLGPWEVGALAFRITEREPVEWK